MQPITNRQKRRGHIVYDRAGQILCGVIPLTKGKLALVDVDDMSRLTEHNWCATFKRGAWRAQRKVASGGTRTHIYMHREILCLRGPECVDHIDGNGLNNQKSNLRLCTNAQNRQNQKTPCTNTSGMKGVSWDKKKGRWRAHIGIYGQCKFLGYFGDTLAAGLAYNNAATVLYGEFARLNVIPTISLAQAEDTAYAEAEEASRED